MGKKTAIALLTVFVLSLTSISYAGYLKGFKVVGVSNGQVTIQKGDAEPIQVTEVRGKFNAGELVKYDAEKHKIKKAVVRKAIAGC